MEPTAWPKQRTDIALVEAQHGQHWRGVEHRRLGASPKAAVAAVTSLGYNTRPLSLKKYGSPVAAKPKSKKPVAKAKPVVKAKPTAKSASKPAAKPAPKKAAKPAAKSAVKKLANALVKLVKPAAKAKPVAKPKAKPKATTKPAAKANPAAKSKAAAPSKAAVKSKPSPVSKTAGKKPAVGKAAAAKGKAIATPKSVKKSAAPVKSVAKKAPGKAVAPAKPATKPAAQAAVKPAAASKPVTSKPVTSKPVASKASPVKAPATKAKPIQVVNTVSSKATSKRGAAARTPQPVHEPSARLTGGIRARAIVPNRPILINEPPPVVATVRVDLPAGYRPGPNEEFMSPYQLEYFRNKLTSWREELVEESKQTIDNLREEVRDVGDEAERATRETENSLELRTRDRYRKLISKIDKALKRIEDGSYGYCEETGEEIGVERLEARPIATLCLDAQERWEHRQKLMGD